MLFSGVGEKSGEEIYVCAYICEIAGGLGKLAERRGDRLSVSHLMSCLSLIMISLQSGSAYTYQMVWEARTL